MNRFLSTYFFTFVLLAPFQGWAQDGYATKTVNVLPTTRLFIHGEANVKKFSCVFNAHYLNKESEVKYVEENNSIRFKNAVLSLANEGFDCGHSAINKDFHKLLQTKEHPRILIELQKITLLEDKKGRVEVLVTIAGRRKKYTIPIDIVSSPIDRFVGQLHLNIRDFDLEPPTKMFGLIVIKDEVEITFDLLARF